MARLVVFGSMGDYPGLEEVTDRVIEAHLGCGRSPGRLPAAGAARHPALGGRPDDAAGQPGRERGRGARGALRPAGAPGRGPRGHVGPVAPSALVAADIRRWQQRIENTVPGGALVMPAGDPIGGSSRGGGRPD